MIKTSLEIKLSHFLKEGEPNFFASLLKSVLVPFSYGFRAVVYVKNRLYDRQLLKEHRCAIPVVSIGNVVAGGTGKTPATLLLAEELSTFCKVAILSRGYRSEAEKGNPPLLLSRGEGPLCGAEKCGDEAYLLASRVPKAIVVVGKDRASSSTKAIEEGAEVILLDDGMQHRKLFRDVEIAVVNRELPFGGGYFLPRGFLRDEPGRLSKADLVIVNGDKFGKEIVEGVPTVNASYLSTAILDLEEREIRLEKGTAVALFCGIAEPSRFVKTVKDFGVDVVFACYLPDHKKVKEKKLWEIAALAKQKGASYLLCTEKDKVKLFLDEKMRRQLPLPIGWVKGELVIQSNQEAWKMMIEKIKTLVKR